MNFRFSNHALEEMARRGITVESLEQILYRPQQVLDERDGKKVYQSQIDFGEGKMYLLRVIVNDTLDPSVVITAYRTRNIKKYWRSE